MKPKNINKICFQAAFWPAISVVTVSILLSFFLFKKQMQYIYSSEVTRHELISQLATKALITDVIIQNEDAIYVALQSFRKKYDLNKIAILDAPLPTQRFNIKQFLSNQKVASTWVIPGIHPSKYIVICSRINSNAIIMPMVLSSGIILLFVLASFLMFQRIKKELNMRIIKPLRHTLHNNDVSPSQFDFSIAATEISDLYDKTQDFLKTLHKQRDTIENNKIKDAQYQMALQVAHDIRSPALTLETISALSSELKADNKALIKRVTKRIVEIADNILKAHAPSATESMLGDIVENIINEKKAYCPNPNIEFKSEIDPSAYHVVAQIPEEKLSRALSNIINNAIEAIDGYGTITAQVSLIQNQIQISISDTGKGIPLEHLDKIFEPTFTAGKPDGKGLGLAYAKQVIEDFGGSISIESLLKNGLAVNILI